MSPAYDKLRAAHADLLLRKSELYPSDPRHAELQHEVDLHIAAIIGWHDEMGDRPACPRVAAGAGVFKHHPGCGALRGWSCTCPRDVDTDAVVERVFAKMLEVA